MKKREIRIQLPEEFISLCDAGGVSPEAVLKSFIGDVCGFTAWRKDGFYSNGAEARISARQYLDQTDFVPL